MRTVPLLLFVLLVWSPFAAPGDLVHTFKNNLDPQLMDAVLCKQLTRECFMWKTLFKCRPSCYPKHSYGVYLHNPCREFVEPCFGIPLQLYLNMRNFTDDYAF